MAIEMKDINETVKAALEAAGLEYTIDNRVECLSSLAHHISKQDEFEIEERVRVGLDIAVEIVRLRVEKQMFGL